MKKTLAILIVFAICTSGIFALESSSFGVSFGYGLQSEFVSGEGVNTQSLVIGITGYDQFSKNSNFALIVDGQFEIPLKQGDIRRSDINNLKTWMNTGVVFGPAYIRVVKGSFKSFIGVGLAFKEQLMRVSSYYYDYSALVLGFGPGVVLHGTYNVSDSFYVSATMSQQYLFLNYAKINSGKLTRIEESFTLSTTARIGCGFTFNWGN